MFIQQEVVSPALISIQTPAYPHFSKPGHHHPLPKTDHHPACRSLLKEGFLQLFQIRSRLSLSVFTRLLKDLSLPFARFFLGKPFA
jgi:hypothetical protein